MANEMKADFRLFVKRYHDLKNQFFSPRSNPTFEDGQEVPSAFPSKSQIAEVFLKQMQVNIPHTVGDTVIRFLDGRTFDYGAANGQANVAK